MKTLDDYWKKKMERHDTAEFHFNDEASWRRNDKEHPEQAYRRGYQQGAMTVLKGLREAKALDPWTLRKLEEFVGIKIWKWRYGKRKLKREMKDWAPEFEARMKS